MCDPAMRTLGLYEGEPAPPLPPGVPPGATILSLEEIKRGIAEKVGSSDDAFSEWGGQGKALAFEKFTKNGAESLDVFSAALNSGFAKACTWYGGRLRCAVEL